MSREESVSEKSEIRGSLFARGEDLRAGKRIHALSSTEATWALRRTSGRLSPRAASAVLRDRRPKRRPTRLFRGSRTNRTSRGLTVPEDGTELRCWGEVPRKCKEKDVTPKVPQKASSHLLLTDRHLRPGLVKVIFNV